MGSAIPFFYADLIARVIPGAAVLALLQLTNLVAPLPWRFPDFGSAEPVVVPLLYGGLAYVIGGAFEFLSSGLLESLYVSAFRRASKTFPWTYSPKPEGGKTREARDLSRASFGHLIVNISGKETQAISHVIRFHSEAKMCFALSFILAAFFVAIIVDSFLPGDVIVAEIDGSGVWLVILVLTIPVMFFCAYQRLVGRARFVLRAIERLASEEEFTSFQSLRDELRRFSNRINQENGKPAIRSNTPMNPPPHTKTPLRS
jgi:hypothetical protein